MTKEQLREEFIKKYAHGYIGEFISALDNLSSQATKEAVEKEKNRMQTLMDNICTAGRGFTARCYQCGTKHASGMSWEEAYRANALFGKCVDCLSKEAYAPHSKDEHICCDGECNHDDCCGKIEANCPIKSSCNHVMVDIGKYERECKFCKLTELRATK